MAESKAHMDYVRKIISYVQENIRNVDSILVLADLPEKTCRPPKVINGYCPDVYHRNTRCFVIGEAKTDDDILNKHTEGQLNSYIEEVRCYHVERHIVLCTSVKSFPVLKNEIIRKKRKENLNDITFHILDVFNRSDII